MRFPNDNITVGMVVSAIPESKHLFKALGVDYCCGGHRLLESTLMERNLNREEVYDKLNALEAARIRNAEKETDPSALPAEELTVFIENKHHAYLRKALPEGLELLTTLVNVHGARHKELLETYRLFGKLKAELEQHLLKEEILLFPELLGASNPDRIQALSSLIIEEHEAAGGILEQLRAVTNGYTAPADGCGTYRRAFALLEAIEQDLHEHIHLENNILLKEYDRRQGR